MAVFIGVAESICAKKGLDVAIHMGGPQARHGCSGALDFAIVSSSFIPPNAIREGAPYVAIAAMFQTDPQVLIAYRSSGITTLAGMKVSPILISNLANRYGLMPAEAVLN